MRQTTALHCTRCGHTTSENDLDVRFKHGDIIACSGCIPVVLVIPTAEEMKMSMRMPLIGAGLDPEIEQRELQDIFFVSIVDFKNATIEKLGCQPTPDNRRQIREAFMKASNSLIHAIVEGEMKSRRKVSS